MNLKELEEQIKYHNEKYWTDNDPEISDSEYDSLVEQLPEGHPLRGYMPDPVAGFKHDRPMLSLAKAYSSDELIKWATGVTKSTTQTKFTISPKYDGLAIELGQGYVVTRGDGHTGEDVSSKRSLISFPDGEPSPDELPVRGELVLHKGDLEKVFRSDGTPFKNLRQAVAGLINSKDTPDYPGVLKFYPHFAGPDYKTYDLAELASIDFEKTCKWFQDEAVYPIDGLVVSLADQEYADSLGATEHHPLSAVAFKVKNPSTTSKIIDVIWQVAKTRLAPVAILEPTELDGTTVTKCTLHNLDEIARLGVQIGSKIQLERMGSVIPGCTKALSTGTSDIIPPTECPACGAPTIRTEQNVHCTNQSCGGQAAAFLKDALARLAVEECGPAVCSELVRLGYTTLLHVLRMTKIDWMKLDGFAERSATKMWRQIQNRLATPIEDWRLLAAQNFEGIGQTLSKRICDKLSLAEIFDPNTDLSQIDGIGPERAKAVKQPYDWTAFVMMFQNVVQTKGLASRPTVCFSGAHETSRDQWIKIAEGKGYAYSKSVTKTLSLLVLADVSSNSGKAKKAAQYGTKILTYEEFNEL